MDDKNNKIATAPGPLAVLCGRLIFVFVGLVLFAVPTLTTYFGGEESEMRTWGCLAAGIGMIFAGCVLPPRTVANLGFDLPFYLPDDDD